MKTINLVESKLEGLFIIDFETDDDIIENLTNDLPSGTWILIGETYMISKEAIEVISEVLNESYVLNLKV